MTGLPAPTTDTAVIDKILPASLVDLQSWLGGTALSPLIPPLLHAALIAIKSMLKFD
jgi:hypothetical protein